MREKRIKSRGERERRQERSNEEKESGEREK